MAQTGGATPAVARIAELEGEVAHMRDERDALSRQLAASEQHVKTLQTQRDAALNRIDWAIDSLHNVLDEPT